MTRVDRIIEAVVGVSIGVVVGLALCAAGALLAWIFG